MTPSLLRVMYAPLDYVHVTRFSKPGCGLSRAVQQSVNRTLIQRYELTTALDFSISTGDFSQRLVDDWELLPTVAWLLGCKLARGSLARSGQLAALPVAAHRFIALPIACPACSSEIRVSSAQIELLGARYLYQLQENLPRALAQRLSLVFPADYDVMPINLSLNRSLLTFAFDYAKNSRH